MQRRWRRKKKIDSILSILNILSFPLVSIPKHSHRFSCHHIIIPITETDPFPYPAQPPSTPLPRAAPTSTVPPPDALFCIHDCYFPVLDPRNRHLSCPFPYVLASPTIFRLSPRSPPSHRKKKVSMEVPERSMYFFLNTSKQKHQNRFKTSNRISRTFRNAAEM